MRYIGKIIVIFFITISFFSCKQNNDEHLKLPSSTAFVRLADLYYPNSCAMNNMRYILEKVNGSWKLLSAKIPGD